MPAASLRGTSKQHLATKLSNIMMLTSTPTSSSVSDADSSDKIHALDCNLAALCEHVQAEGWNAGLFSDIVVHAMGSSYCLHRLVLSRSSVFRNMLLGPWKEAGATEVTLQIDDKNVNGEAVAIALSYLYGHHPKLNDSNAFRVLAAASFLDLQDLCAICTEFIISEIWTDNFLAYQAFAESQEYGIYGERVRRACWGYLCRGGAVELKEVLPKLSTHTLRTLLISDELWVPSEEKRFELALSVLISRGALCEVDGSQLTGCIASPFGGEATLFSLGRTKEGFDRLFEDKTKATSKTIGLNEGNPEGDHVAQNIVLELADAAVEYCNKSGQSSSLMKDRACQPQQAAGTMCVCRSEKPGSPSKSQIEVDIEKAWRKALWEDLVMDMRKSTEASTVGESCSSQTGQETDYFGTPLECYSFRDQSQNCSASQVSNITAGRYLSPNDWSRDGSPFPGLTWGGRVVGRRRMKMYPRQRGRANNEDWEAFLGVFEGGGVFYCHMGFEELLHVRARLEELGFPCKAVSDALWLQTLLKQHVLTIAAETCKTCSFFGTSCSCKQYYNYSHCRAPSNFYREEQDRSAGVVAAASGFHADAQAGVGNIASVQGRVHVRGPVDGLAGIGRGSTFGPPGAAWSPSRFMFTRIPFTGFGNRPHQQNAGNDQSDARIDLGGIGMPAQSADGLPAAVGLIQSGNGGAPIHSNQSGNIQDQFGKVVGETSREPESSSHTSQNLDAEHPWGQDWETQDSISLDLETPLRTFPPFRFGAEFENVHRLADGQSKHSSESFYAGSLWKVSVQAFHDEDPQGRRTLGLFLHRRQAETIDSHRKVYLYTDNREKVTARYQLICPAKREVMIFGSITQAGTLLPKSPKGWGWRTAFLFDELHDLLQGGPLRVAAVVQLV